MKIKIILEPFECNNYSNLNCSLYKGEIEETLMEISGVEYADFSPEDFTVEIKGDFSLEMVKKELAKENYLIKNIE